MSKEREQILEKLHWYVAVGDPALIKGVDKAIQLIEELEKEKESK